MSLTFQEYQDRAHQTAVYPKENAETYALLGLLNEVGELAGKFKKYLRGDYSWEDMRDMLGKEAGDVQWYLAEVCTVFDVNLEAIAEGNLEKLFDRAQRGVLKGDGDER